MFIVSIEIFLGGRNTLMTAILQTRNTPVTVTVFSCAVDVGHLVRSATVQSYFKLGNQKKTGETTFLGVCPS